MDEAKRALQMARKTAEVRNRTSYLRETKPAGTLEKAFADCVKLNEGGSKPYLGSYWFCPTCGQALNPKVPIHKQMIERAKES